MSHLAKDIRRVASPDGAIVLNLRRGTMLRVNPTGSRILELLDENSLPDEIVERLSAEFGIGREVIEPDIADFLESLRAHGVLDRQPANL